MKKWNSFFSLLIVLVLCGYGEILATEPAVENLNKDETWENLTGFDWSKGVHPFVEVSYGLINPAQKKFDGDFHEMGSGDVKLGYSKVKNVIDYVVELDEHFAFGNWISKDLKDVTENAEKVTSEILRFGVGNRIGYGYETQSVRILPYSEMQFSLTKLTTERPLSLSMNDMNILDRYEGSYRFSSGGAGGIRLEFFRSVSFLASYEAAVVYPRIVFWPWLGGAIIQGITVGAVSHFAEDIIDSSPAMGPIMYALLRNGITYVVFLGMKDKMNWPFNSETPLTHEGFRVGFSLTF